MFKSSGLLLVGLVLSACGGGGGSSAATFRVDSATPGIIQGNDTNISWTLTGVGFDPAATVTLPYTGVTVSNVTVVSATQITFTLSAAAGTALGTANIIITNPDSTLANMSVAAVPATVTLSGHVQPIFTSNCAVSGCHTGGAPTGNMNLSAGQAFGATVGVNSGQVPSLQRIQAGNNANSYLMNKLDGTNTVGQRMPIGGSLTITELALIRKWIDGGAPNN